MKKKSKRVYLYSTRTKKVMTEQEAAVYARSKENHGKFFRAEKVNGEWKINRKKFASPFICYVTQLRKWITMEEALAYHRELVNGESPENKEEAPKLARYICDFIEEFEGRPTHSEVGYYEGLVDYLTERKKNKSAKIVETQNILNYIQMAWRLYRKKHPFIERPLPPDLVRRESNAPARKKIFGHNTSYVIRRLALEGYTAEEIRRVLDHYKIECKDTTIKGQMWCATQRGKYGMSAKLSERELECIFDVICATAPKTKHSKKSTSQK